MDENEKLEFINYSVYLS